MQLEIPDQVLVAHCGGDWGNATATDLAVLIKNYLYGSPRDINERKNRLGRVLLDALEHRLAQ